jgi:hypothetical protein
MTLSNYRNIQNKKHSLEFRWIIFITKVFKKLDKHLKQNYICGTQQFNVLSCADPR